MTMFENSITGRISSFQSFGAADGPGIRCVIFMQGCPLRCICCHNPETWSFSGGTEITVEALCDKIIRCSPYFGDNGGVTVSGGEPLCQSEFLIELFKLLKARGINTVLDTSGCILDANAEQLLSLTDLVILDYKYTCEDDYKRYVGCEKNEIDKFLMYLNLNEIKTWIRQVIIPGYNDSVDSINRIKRLYESYSCIKKIELLPFRKLCNEKYETLNIEFKLKNNREPTSAEMDKFCSVLK